MKIFVSTCMILSFLGLSDSVCPRGGFDNDQPQFGPGCMYRCHCVGDVQCDSVTGVCPEGCAAGWMGPGCQYGDIAYNKQVQQLLYGNNSLIDGRNATDRLPLTCVGPTTLVVIDLNATYRISGLIITSREGGVFVYVSQTPIGLLDMPGCIRISVGLPDFGVTVSNSSFVTPSDITRTCFKQNTTEQLNAEIPIVCTTEIIGRYLVIRTPDNATRMTVCDVRVYGGRTLAYGHNASQSTSAMMQYGESVASLASDGNAATNFHSRSCTHTMDETSPWWRVNLELVYNIMRIVLYNRQDCCAERLSGFSVSFATNNTFSLVFKYPETTPMERTEITTLSDDLAQEVEISLRNRTKRTALTLCEVFVFGDSKKYVTHWSDKRWVRKDKLLVTVLLSIYESWDTSMSMDPGDNVKCQVCIGCEKGMVVSVKVRTHVEDCQNNICGWTCDTYCYCDGPIDKENKILAKCPGKCITGWWGHSCNNTCDSNCIGNTCNQRDGHCLECFLGQWGHLCENNCTNCLKDTGCDISNGICAVGCSSGLFGVKCSEPCGHCAGDGSCNRSTGACIHGCQPGWQDENCSIVCSQGWYGLHCSRKCGNCANITCDFVNGTCYLGCSEGFSGIGCFERLATEKITDGSAFSPQIIGIIVGVFMCALLIGIAVGYFIMRIRMRRSASASATSARLESTYDQLDRDKVQNDSSAEYEKIQMKTRMKH